MDAFADLRAADLGLDTGIAAQRLRFSATGPGTEDFLTGAELPYPAGASPHRVKGTAFLGMFSLANQALGPDGTKRVIKRLDDPSLKAFFERRISATAWEDVYPFFIFARELAAALVMPFPLFLVLTARRSARHDVAGPLRVGLRMVSHQTLVSSMQLMGKAYWQFLSYETSLESPQRLRIVTRGMPLALRDCLLLLGAEYNVEVLRLAGSQAAAFEAGTFSTGESTPGPRSVGEGSYYLKW